MDDLGAAWGSCTTGLRAVGLSAGPAFATANRDSYRASTLGEPEDRSHPNRRIYVQSRSTPSRHCGLAVKCHRPSCCTASQKLGSDGYSDRTRFSGLQRLRNLACTVPSSSCISRATPSRHAAGSLAIQGNATAAQWQMYAYDTTEKAEIGRRSREWTAVVESEVECVLEMARCMREISEGKVPR